MICHTLQFAGVVLSFFPGWRPASIGYIDNADPAYPVRCHWERAEDSKRCEDVLVYMENAWRAQVDVAGFRPPYPDEDGRVDLYLTNDYTYGGAYTYNNEGDLDDKDGVVGGPAFMAVDWGVPDNQMEGYVSHEFNHVLQYATDMMEPTYNIWEGTATASEMWTSGKPFPTDVFYMSDFQDIPWMGLLGDGYLAWHGYSVYSYYEYGSVAWIRHLEHHWGDGTGIAGAALWEAAAQAWAPNEPDVIEAYDTVTGNWRDAWLHFHEERARMGTPDAPDWQGIADEDLAIGVEEELDYGKLPGTVISAMPVFQTGAMYVAVNGMAEGEAVQITAVGDGLDEWGTVAIEGAEGTYADADSLVWVGQGGQVLLAVVHLGYPDFDGDDALIPRSLQVLVEATEPPPPKDTGDTGDTGTPDTDPPDTDTDPQDTDSDADTGEPGGVDTAQPTGPQDSGKAGGCGCAGSGSAGWLVWPGAVLALALRRRRMPSPRACRTGAVLRR